MNGGWYYLGVNTTGGLLSHSLQLLEDFWGSKNVTVENILFPIEVDYFVLLCFSHAEIFSPLNMVNNMKNNHDTAWHVPHGIPHFKPQVPQEFLLLMRLVSNRCSRERLATWAKNFMGEALIPLMRMLMLRMAENGGPWLYLVSIAGCIRSLITSALPSPLGLTNPLNFKSHCPATSLVAGSVLGKKSQNVVSIMTPCVDLNSIGFYMDSVYLWSDHFCW